VLTAALATLDPARSSRVVLVSDGLSRDPPDTLAAAVVAALGPFARLDTVGLGYDDDDNALAAIARAGRGTSATAGAGPALRVDVRELGAPRDRVGRIDLGRYGVFALSAGRVLEPLFVHAGQRGLVSPSLRAASGLVEVASVHADWEGGLWGDGTALVFGRYRGAGPTRLELAGQIGGERWVHPIDIELPAAEPDNRMIAAFWARREVAALESANGELSAATRARIAELSTRYRFVTSQTALLALTDPMRAKHGLQGPRAGTDELYRFSAGVPEPETILLVVVAMIVLCAARGYGRA
jgi:hypothetical protein